MACDSHNVNRIVDDFFLSVTAVDPHSLDVVVDPQSGYPLDIHAL